MPNHLLIRTLIALGAAMAVINTTDAQAPGDRPAANPRATRSPVLARHGLIATSQPLASAAGLQVLQEGGNAIDAAVAAVAVLSVVEPTMTGIGGDLFAIVWDARTKRLHALNASGRSAYAATPEALAGKGLSELPSDGPLTISVPGAVDGWSELLSRFGTIDLERAVRAAVRHAREGFAVSEIIAGQWEAAAEDVLGDRDAAATFLPGGRAPLPGEIFANPNLARSLELIASGGRDVFYRGELGRRIVAELQKRGSWLTARDFAEHRSDWVEPISTSYRGYDVYEMPPNTQGFVALEMLNILEGFDLGLARSQHARVPPSAHRGQAHRVRGSQRASRRFRLRSPGCAANSAFEGVRGPARARRSTRSTRPRATNPGRARTARARRRPTARHADSATRCI